VRVVLITYHTIGGAGSAVLRLHNRLRDYGIDSQLVLATNLHYAAVPAQPSWLKQIRQKCRRKFARVYRRCFLREDYEKYAFFSPKELEPIKILNCGELVKDGDVVIFGWLGHIMNSRNMREILQGKNVKAYWFAFDMAPVTGGCHYFWDCLGYQKDCRHCPAVAQFDFAARQLASKKRTLAGLQIGLLASSDTGLRTFRKASLQFSPYHKLPYPINAEVFTPAEVPVKTTSGINVLFNAQDRDVVRKGFNHVVQCAKLLDKMLPQHMRVNFMTVHYADHRPHFEGLTRCQLLDCGPPTTTDADLAKLYQQADVLLCTSIEDLSPLMVNEALLCGVPVIGFDNCSNSEYVRNGGNGYLIPPLDVAQMAEVISDYCVGRLVFNDKNAIRQSVLELHAKEHWLKYFKELL